MERVTGSKQPFAKRLAKKLKEDIHFMKSSELPSFVEVGESPVGPIHFFSKIKKYINSNRE